MAVFPHSQIVEAQSERRMFGRGPFHRGPRGVDVDGDVVVARHIVVGVPRMFAFVPVDF